MQSTWTTSASTSAEIPVRGATATITDDSSSSLESFPTSSQLQIILAFFQRSRIPTVAHLDPTTFNQLYDALHLPHGDRLELKRKKKIINACQRHIPSVSAAEGSSPALGWTGLVAESERLREEQHVHAERLMGPGTLPSDEQEVNNCEEKPKGKTKDKSKAKAKAKSQRATPAPAQDVCGRPGASPSPPPPPPTANLSTSSVDGTPSPAPPDLARLAGETIPLISTSFRAVVTAFGAGRYAWAVNELNGIVGIVSNFAAAEENTRRGRWQGEAGAAVADVAEAAREGKSE